MEDHFDANLFTNREYVEKEFAYKDCIQKYKASGSAATDFDLTGQIVWRSAVQLAEFIVENKELFKDKVVLELGAGAGLSGLVCAQYAKHVYITDGNEIICELMNENVPYAELKNVTAEYFLWGEQDFLEKHRSIHFDIIIGADIMFWPQAIEPLSITISQFYEKNPSLTVFTATRIRAGSSEKSFEENLTRRGLQRRLVFKEGENHFFEIQGISDSDTRTYIYKDATV